jgi:hypothetical protein
MKDLFALIRTLYFNCSVTRVLRIEEGREKGSDMGPEFDYEEIRGL